MFADLLAKLDGYMDVDGTSTVLGQHGGDLRR